MKLIIAGSRELEVSVENINEYVHFFNLADKVEEVVSGNNGNVDLGGEKWSTDCLGKDPKIFAAPWHVKNSLAGPYRNEMMAVYADALLIIWDGRSPGSTDMKTRMLTKQKPVYEVFIRDGKITYIDYTKKK